MSKFVFCILVILSLLSCNKQRDIRKPDITYINYSYILPHDTASFKNGEEEYRFLCDANNLKKDICDNALAIIDVIMDKNPEVLQDDEIKKYLSNIDKIFAEEQ